MHVSATPKVNAQSAPYETIKNKVVNCASHRETVTLTQHINGPFAQVGKANRKWVVTVLAGGTVTKVQHLPYSCCGSYTLTDKALSSGQVLDQSQTSFTFA